MIYLLYQNRHFKPQIEYVFRVVLCSFSVEWKIVESDELSMLQSKPEDILISYGKRKPSGHSFKNHIHIYESELFGKDYLKLESLPCSPLKRSGDLPIIYGAKGGLPGPVIMSMSPDCRTIETDIDIISSSFFMLARYEEVLVDKKDEHGRFPARESLAYKEGFLNRPVVNEYIELLWSWIQFLNLELGRKPPWPEGKRFAICLTHDVDRLRKYPFPSILAIGGLLLRQRNPLSALSLTWDYIKVCLHIIKDPFDTFDYMLNMEQGYGIKSSFYFMTARDTAYDPRYSINEAGTLNLIRRIEDRGCEIGLHTNYNSYDNPERIALEKERLDRAVRDRRYGCRQHFLRWRSPDTWRHQEKAGILYDTSLAFADHVGFRAGICFPFKLFDVIENRELDIWELPLTVMEGTLQSANYQNLPPEKAYEEITKYIEMVKRFNGVFVILWHNSSFDPLGGWEGWGEVYEQVMKYIGEQDAFVSSGREIVEEWRKRLPQA